MQVSRSILAVDDDGAILRVVRESLGAFQGAEVVTSSDAEYGFELALRQEFDLFVFDLEMPGLTGDRLYRLIGKSYQVMQPKPRHLPPLLLMSDFGGDSKTRDLLQQPGIKDILPKPFEVDRLLEKVEKTLPPKEIGVTWEPEGVWQSATRRFS